MKNFLQENWFKVAVLILTVWFLLILSGVIFPDSFEIEVCHKSAKAGLPSLASIERCY